MSRSADLLRICLANHCYFFQIGAQNGRLVTGCTSGNNSTNSVMASDGQLSGTSRAQPSSVVPATKQSSSSPAPSSAGAIFTGAASSVQPAVNFLAAVIGVMALL